MSNLPDLVSGISAAVGRKIRILPRASNRSSDLGDPCERRLWYARTRPLEAAPPGVSTQMIFDLGNLHEEDTLRLLRDAGFLVQEQQRSLEWREYQITGHLDATIVVDGVGIPVDVKSMGPQIFSGIFGTKGGVYEWSAVEDGFRRKSWLRKYLGQITLYCLMTQTEWGILLCRDKSSGAFAQVNVPLDYRYGEFLLKRAERINALVASGDKVGPPRIDQEASETCPHCPFMLLCLPDQAGRSPLVLLRDAELERMLDERGAKETAGRRFHTLDAKLKDWAKARTEDRLAVGTWVIEKTKSGRGTRVSISGGAQSAKDTAEITGDADGVAPQG